MKGPKTQEGVLEKILIEYEESHCSKVEKKVTITSMVIKESNETVTPILNAEQAFDCDQKLTCGLLTILGKQKLVNWNVCTHPKLSPG
jgi:hypothetical protein